VEGLAQLVPFILIAVVFWLLLIRPQRKRQLEVMATQRSVTVGEEVLLGAGIVGRVVGDSEEYLELEIAPGVAMKVARAAVVRVLHPEDELDTGDALEPDEGVAPTPLDAPEPSHPSDPSDPTRDR
jgi:preprotein translocase subunit YajC